MPTALAALPAGIAAGIAASLAIDRVAYAPFRCRGAAPAALMIASIAVILLLNRVVRVLVGPETRHFADGARFLLRPADVRAATGLEEGLMLRTGEAPAIVVAGVEMAALFAFLHRNRTGSAMRAHADTPELAILCGVETGRVVRLTWAIAAGPAALAGVLCGLDKAFSPATCFHLMLPVFAAVILGGIGNPKGAVPGALVIAFAEIGLTCAYRGAAAHLLSGSLVPDELLHPVATDYRFAIGFAVLVAVLAVRPTGLFGRARG